VIGKNKERWEELCELATKEQDPQKLIELMKEIDRLLEIKLNRLKPAPAQRVPASHLSTNRCFSSKKVVPSPADPAL